MPLYTVRRRVDAFVDYLVEVEAEGPAEAAELAAQEDRDLAWRPEDVCEFDDRIFIALSADGDEIADTEVRG